MIGENYMKMIEFHKLETNDFDDCNFMYIQRGYHPYWLVTIDLDGQNDNDNYYIYGFISPDTYYDHAIVVSDDTEVSCKTNKDGEDILKRSEVKKAYGQVCKQLKERYKEWFKENM